MPKRTCSVKGCRRPVQARGWCIGHYARWKTHGDVDAGRPLQVRDFWAKVDKTGRGGCWLWTGYLNPAGYGQAGRGGKIHLTHRRRSDQG